MLFFFYSFFKINMNYMLNSVFLSPKGETFNFSFLTRKVTKETTSVPLDRFIFSVAFSYGYYPAE